MTIVAKDFGSYLAAVVGAADGAATAAGTGDATYKAGAIHDLRTLDHPLSGLIVVPWTATLGDTETVSFKTKIEHGEDSGLSDAATYTFGGDEIDHGVAATSDGGTTEVGCLARKVDLSGLKRYFRISVYIDLSASGTDTAEFGTALVLGGLANMS